MLCEEHVRSFSNCFAGELVFRKRGKFEEIEVWDNPYFGRILVIDGQVQLSERDERLYHEALVHVPMSLHGDPGRVLIIGGGDGGAAREASKYSRDVTIVDIEPLVPEVSRKFLPSVSKGLEDVKLVFMDAFDFVERERGSFDVVIADTTDPVGPARKLATIDFYRMVKKRLGKGGFFAGQLGSPILDARRILTTLRDLESVFRHVLTYFFPVPTYPSGVWSFFMASDEEIDLGRARLKGSQVLRAEFISCLELLDKQTRRLVNEFSAL